MRSQDKTQFEVFISSRINEFADERQMLYELIPTLGNEVADLMAWVYEINAPASDHTIRDNYLRTLIDSELYIAILGQGYGEWTVDEFNIATRESIPRHVYILVMDDDQRDPRLISFINQIQGVEFGIAPRYFTNMDDLRRAVADSVQVWLRERVMHRPGSTTAIFAKRPLMVESVPDKLIGREHLLARINSLLDVGEMVLLRGFGGMGKTALAATIAKQHILDGKGAVLWQKLGSEVPDVVFQALARPFGAHQTIAAAQSDDEKRAVIRTLIVDNGVKLVVLDDAWDGKTLNAVMRAIPVGIPAIITSRHRYGLRNIIEVGELAPDKAIETLSFYAAANYANDEGAKLLCKYLGYHAFALEIAGRTIIADNLTPATLLDRVRNAPQNLKAPDEFAEEGRVMVADLITASLTMLDNETQRVFLALGAFFAKQITSEMLALYFTDIPPVTSDMIARARAEIPEVAQAKDEEIRQIYQQATAQNLRVPIEAVEKSLETLARRGLIEREKATDRSIASIRIHDLAYSYAHLTHPESNLHRALEVCIVYTWRYNQPSLANFAALRPELDNFLGAAGWAMQVGRLEEVERFAWNLYRGSDFLEYQGFYAQAITLLELAVQAAERIGDIRSQGAHLGHLGLTYHNLGKYENAIQCYEQALSLSRMVGDRQAESSDLGNLGTTYRQLGQYGKAIEYYEQALVITREIGDRRGEGNHLGNLGVMYRQLGQYTKAIEYYEQGLAISREIGDRRGEGNDLGNLGVIYRQLGQVKKAIEHYEQGLAISREIGDRRSESNHLGNLGNAYTELEQLDHAIEYYEQGLAISREIGDRQGEGTTLGNLGTAYRQLGQYAEAIESYQKAITMDQEIGDIRNEGLHISNLGTVLAELNQIEGAVIAHERALLISRQIGNQMNEANELNRLSTLYALQDKFELATSALFQARKIFGDLDLPKQLDETNATSSILRRRINTEANVAKQDERYGDAISLYRILKSLDQHNLSSSDSRNTRILDLAESTFELALCLSQAGQTHDAIKELDYVIVMYKELEDLPKLAVATEYLARLHVGTLNYEKGRLLLKDALRYYTHIGDNKSMGRIQERLAQQAIRTRGAKAIPEAIEKYTEAVANYLNAGDIENSQRVKSLLEQLDKQSP